MKKIKNAKKTIYKLPVSTGQYPIYPLYREPEDVLYDLLEEIIENQEEIIELLDKETND